ncbi:hypothetical protein C8Q72DRAFT_944308 [Fomitopsis betulina]|nr:hypothetical protein C8Q72DRAFT_944308 [Fomitopsis betulina]
MAMPRAAIRNACCTPSPDDPATAYPGTILDDASSIYSSIGVRGFDQYASAVQRHIYFEMTHKPQMLKYQELAAVLAASQSTRSHAAMDTFFDISTPVPSEAEPSQVLADYDHSNGNTAWSCTVA